MKLEYSIENPLNREPPAPELVSKFITPAKLAYDRNHSPLPHLDASKHRVIIDGAVQESLSFTVDELKARYKEHSIVAALQCAGNRRHTMRTELKEVNGIDWFSGAVMNGEWTGVLLADVLRDAGVTLKDGNGHVCFECRVTGAQDDTCYGGSITLERASDPQWMVLLCYQLNNSPLDVKHGSPLRLVAPGIAGARWVKWLDRITVSAEESQNYYQQKDYKILPPTVATHEEAEANWKHATAIMGMPVNSVVARPVSDKPVAREPDGSLVIKGYALPACDDGPITRVEVSIDHGRTWRDATLTCTPTRWSWATWQLILSKTETDALAAETDPRIWSRAHDQGGNIQPEKCEWNYRGVAYNAYGESKRFTVAEAEVEEVDGELTNGVEKSVNGEVNGVEKKVNGVEKAVEEIRRGVERMGK